MDIEPLAIGLLSGRRQKPIHIEPRGIGVRRVADDAPAFRGCRQPPRRGHKGNRRTLRLPFEIAGILRGVDQLVLLIDQAVVLLDVGVEGARFQLSEFLPVIGPEGLAQLEPGDVLQSGIRYLDADRIGPFRVERLLPGLWRIARLHDSGVVGETRRRDRAPNPVPDRLAFVLALIRGHFR